MREITRLFSIVFLFSFQFSLAQNQLSKQAITEDLAFLEEHLQTYSSYQGLNAYDYQKDFKNYLVQLDDNNVSDVDFGLFLSKVIGRIGDRHSYIKGYDLPDEHFLPFYLAPLEDKIVALKGNKRIGKMELLYDQFPYFTAINGEAIADFMQDIMPRGQSAPKEAFHTRAIMRFRDIERSYAAKQLVFPKHFQFTFSGEKGDTILSYAREELAQRYWIWDEKFHFLFGQKKEELNDTTLCKQLFQIGEDSIAYGRIPDMVDPKTAPLYFEAFHQFMQDAKSSKAMILDIRSNDGGTRDMIFEVAKYLVSLNAIHIVNIAQQRRNSPLDKDRKNSLHGRYLYAIDELDTREQAAVQDFMQTFEPMYDLDEKRFSENYYCLFNGEKLTSTEVYHYDKPVYILMNERCFSASSIFAAVFKDLANVTLAGVRTDGSSGNSIRFELPNSGLRGKLSTMVSFQKDGIILDGYGTTPDIEIKRNLEQILWQKDHQLEELKRLIREK